MIKSGVSTKQIAEFKGLSNKYEPLDMPDGYLKVATNIDIDDVSNVRRCNGFSAPVAYTNITDSYNAKNTAYIIDNGSLKQALNDVAIVSGLSSEKYSWCSAGSVTYIRGTDIAGRIENGQFTDLYIPSCPSPNVVIGNGNLQAGVYTVACAYQTSNGLEGGVSSNSTITLPDNSGIIIEVPQLEGFKTSIYITHVNSKTLYRWFSTEDTSVAYNDYGDLTSIPLSDFQLNAYPIPENAEAIEFFNGKLTVGEYISNDGKSVIWFSQLFMPHLFKKHEDYIVVTGKVTNIININEHKLVISTEDAIYAYDGDTLISVAQYGAPKGATHQRNYAGVYFLYTHNGILNLNDFSNLTTDVVDLPIGTEAHSCVVKRNGYEQFITLVINPQANSNTFRS